MQGLKHRQKVKSPQEEEEEEEKEEEETKFSLAFHAEGKKGQISFYLVHSLVYTKSLVREVRVAIKSVKQRNRYIYTSSGRSHILWVISRADFASNSCKCGNIVCTKRWRSKWCTEIMVRLLPLELSVIPCCYNRACLQTWDQDVRF